MEPSPTSRVSGVAAGILHRLRTWPWLTAAAFVFGVVLAALDTAGGWREVASRYPMDHGLSAILMDEGARGAWLEWFQSHWNRATVFLLPAALLATLRLRQKGLIIPVAVAALHLTAYYLGTDLLENYHLTLNDPLGMQPSSAAYTVKLVLMGLFFLSPPVLLWLYCRANTLDRYLLRNFLGPLALCLGGILAILITMDLLNNANDFTGLSGGQVVSYYIGQIPRMVVTVAEAALLLATLFALGKMSRHNELISYGSAGRSVVRTLMPLLLTGLWCSLAVLALNYQHAPEAERAKEVRNKTSTDIPAILYRNREGHRTWCLYRVPYNLSGTSPIEDITVVQQDAAGNLLESWFARTGMWTAATGTWQLHQVVRYEHADPVTGAKLHTPRRTEMAECTQTKWRETPAAMLSDKLDPEFLGVPGLLSALQSRTTLPPRAIAGYETTLHWRFALPFRCFLIVLLAAPLGIVASRRNVLGGVSAAIGIFIALRFLSTIVLKAGEGLYLPPAAAAWSINIAFGIAGILLIQHRSSNRAFSLNLFRRLRRA